MGSPENDKTTTPTTTTIPATISPSDSVAIQDSAIFSYMSNLSPIKPVKATPVVPGFPGLGSPIVFTSPRLYPLPETSYLKRPRCSQLSSSVLSQQDVRGKKISICSNEIEKSKTEGSSALVPCSVKECENKGSVQDQATSPSGCIDDYLADAVEVDCVNSAHSGSLSLIQSGDVPQSLNDCSDLKEMIPKLDNKNYIGQDAEKALGAFSATSELAGQDFQEKLSFDNKPVETYTKQRSSEMPPRVCLKDESDLSVGKAFEEQHYELPVAQHAGAAHEEQWDCATQLLPESFQPIQGYGDCGKTTIEASNRLVENTVLHDPKGKQKWGMRRRCLRFEEAQQNIVAKSPGFGSPSNIVTSSRLSASLADLEDFESSCLEVSATSSGRQLINLTQPMISPRNSENSRSTVSKPSGIGLHLNSIINAIPLGCGATGSMKSAEKGCLNVEGRKLVCQRPTNTKTASILLNVREKGSASSEDGSHETQTLVAISSLASQSPQIVKPSNDPVLLKRCEYQTTQCDKRKSISKHADAVEELNQSSPKKKRKKASSTNDDDGCKRCNCKKTKCLKLYCDCFAAGIYCAETCTCQECFNRPEYEDTVLETRQQIESRNPLAFAPKIVQHVTDPPANSNGEDVINSTPYSARHKRGCNCKKSLCLKKYCECYQANVGCSNGCRCEGCKNVYGRKEGPIHESFENTFDEKLEMVSNQEGLLQAELCNPQNLTPLTPSFQFLDHGKDSSKSRFSTRRCLPSPEPNVTFLPPYGKSPGSPKNSDNHDMLLKARKDIEDVVSCYQELDYSNVETVDEFSSRYDGLVNGYDLSTLPNPPSTTMASSASSRISDWTTISRSQLYPGSGHLSSVGSLHWHISPITSVAQFGGTKLLKAVDSDEKLHDIMEDDMPEILKDASTPLNAVKVSSPNKKRVSPPHSSLKELGSSSSAGLRSGQKFILRAVPSFPPLTPSIDSKASTSQNVNDPEDCISKK